jgi:hypothetical protein
MRTARRVAGVVLLAGAVLLALVPVAAEATTLTQAGWWWRANDGALPATVPAPPNVPEGGLMVAGAPDGATAIAALHFELADDETAPVLTLAMAENGDQGGDTAILAACLTGSAWQPASGGTWTSKPFPACSSGSVTGVRADDGATWTFALAPLLSDGIIDVTLVPGIDPTLPAGVNGSVFQLVFAAPTAASLTTTKGAGPTTDFELPDFSSPDLGAGGGASGFDAPALGGGLSLGPVDAAAGFSPALPEADQGLTATAPVVQQRNEPLTATPAGLVEDHKGLGALVLVLCGGALLWSAQQPSPAPRRLGSFEIGPAEDALAVTPADAAGLGRFARARSGAPPRL